jgi:hypothetical protein
MPETYQRTTKEKQEKKEKELVSATKRVWLQMS